MSRPSMAVVILLLLPLGANAQTAPVPDDIQLRLQALEEQVRALQAEIAALKAAAREAPVPAAAAGPPQPQTPSALAAPPTGGEAQAPGPLPVYGGGSAGKLLNPDVGMIGNFLSATGESRGGSDAVAPIPLLTLQESEASLQAIVDPYARATSSSPSARRGSRWRRAS